jgi:hypothetical protein
MIDGACRHRKKRRIVSSGMHPARFIFPHAKFASRHKANYSLGGTSHGLPVQENSVMLAAPIAALTVASIFYSFREYQTILRKKQSRLRQRVAFMLWTMADNVAA